MNQRELLRFLKLSEGGSMASQLKAIADALALQVAALQDKEKEIERLTAEHKAAELLWWDEKGALEDQISELQAEVERQEKFIEHLLGECPNNCKHCGE